jgi:AraC-like DNA-binding protein
MIIGFFGIKQTPIFTTHHPYQDLPNPKISDPDPTAPEPEKISAEEVQKRYETSGLSQSKKMEIAEELKKRVEEEKLFLDAELSLDMLADHLQIHPNYLSQYINEELSLTFYDYINAKRVEEFKRISHLPEKQHFSLLGLALECGFNSKSSFNRNFKKFVGLTPSEYLNSVKA